MSECDSCKIVFSQKYGLSSCTTFASSSIFRSISAHAFCPVSSFVLLLINSHTYKHAQIPRESRAIYSWIPQELRNGGKMIFWFWTDSDWLFQRLVFVSEPLPYALPSQTSEPRWPPSQKWGTWLENTCICRHTHTSEGFNSEFSWSIWWKTIWLNWEEMAAQ